MKHKKKRPLEMLGIRHEIILNIKTKQKKQKQESAWNMETNTRRQEILGQMTRDQDRQHRKNPES